MKAYLELVRAQLLLFARNRNILIFSLLIPVLIILLLGGLGGDGNDFSVRLGIHDADRSAESVRFSGELSKIEGVKLTQGEKENLLRDLRKGELDLVLEIRSGFGRDLRNGQPSAGESRVVLYLDKSNAAMARMGTDLIGMKLDAWNKERTGYRPLISMDVADVRGNRLGYIDFLVPGILALMIMNNNLNGVAGAIASWRERGILRRMQSTPLSSASFIAGQMTARVLLGFVQAVVVLLISRFVFDVNVEGSWGLLFLLILLGTLTFMSMGFIIASLSRTPETAGPIAGLISFPMMFVGGIFFPLRDMPDILQPVVHALPISWLSTALRQVMNEGAGWTDVLMPGGVLLAWLAGSFLVAALTFRWDVK
ncbi:ABC transporter permease [Staphylospora marina]|uniref:ABC transporter permease n=1 Tax=Staphylospora marina TaxID=2490858 RepID=UPI000F5BC34F|nr:ABC transporter permease [Staphylospora marina]